MGTAQATAWSYQPSEDLAYVVSVSNYPPGSLDKYKIVGVYDAILDRLTQLTGEVTFTLSEQANYTLNGHLGRSFTLTSQLVAMKGAMFVVGDNVYEVWVGYAVSITDLTEIDTFIADFQPTV